MEGEEVSRRFTVSVSVWYRGFHGFKEERVVIKTISITLSRGTVIAGGSKKGVWP